MPFDKSKYKETKVETSTENVRKVLLEASKLTDTSEDFIGLVLTSAAVLAKKYKMSDEVVAANLVNVGPAAQEILDEISSRSSNSVADAMEAILEAMMYGATEDCDCPSCTLNRLAAKNKPERK